MMKRLAFVAIAALAMVGCDDGRTNPSTDAGPGGGTDSGTVGLMDSGPGGGTDAGPGTGTDAGPGTGTDAGPGTGTDAGPGGGDACTAVACRSFDCGMVPDGCGGMQDCGDCEIGAPCTDDSGCASGECGTEAERGWHEGYCTLECYEDADCGAGRHCAFTMNSLSRIGSCVTSCGSAADCRGPEYDCVDIDDFGPRECAPVGTGAGAVGDPCTTNTDCAGGEDYLCLREETGWRAGTCSLSCLTDGDCGSGNHCAFVPATGGDGLCLPNCTADTDCRADGYVCTNADEDTGGATECFPGGTDTTAATGDPCTGVWECPGGDDAACLTPDGSGTVDGFCTEIGCTADSDCETGAHCTSFDDGDGGTLGLCLPDCSSDADCRADGYACYDVDEDGGGVTECWIGGTGAGAPGASCTDAGDCAGGARGRCAPNIIDGYCFLLGCTMAGGAGADCPSGSHCSISLDETMTPEEEGICVPDCTTDSDCPMMGQRCFDTADVDTALECFPAATGPGTVGDYCTSFNDCGGEEFGTCLFDLDNTTGVPDFPGGYCSQGCGGVGDPACPAGSSCQGGVCLVTCTMGSDCRPGTDYSCVTPPFTGASGMSCWPN